MKGCTHFVIEGFQTFHGLDWIIEMILPKVGTVVYV